MELISSAFRIAFRDYCSDDLNLRMINNIFSETGIQKGVISAEKLGTFSGERRTLVEEYYASLDWTSHSDIEKFLKALSNFFKLYGRGEDNPIRERLQEEAILIEGNKVSFAPSKGGSGRSVKNLIFAANGPKPEIVLNDALNNDVEIVRNKEYCLVYEKPISGQGLLWRDLLKWWTEEFGGDDPWPYLYSRLLESMSSEPEKLLFKAYWSGFCADLMPALIPQVYLHYDPYTLKHLSNGKRLARQRMDFLMLLPNNVRVVLEVDGKQHYSKESLEGLHLASPALYAEMVAEDRKLKLAGYEVYRFGGYEFYETGYDKILLAFFEKLFNLHSVEIINDLCI